MAVRSLAYKWMGIYLLAVLMLIVPNVVKPMAEKVNLPSQLEKEIELKLKQLNKEPVKSIESSSGEIIDCIPITKQPAFDHPLLKNHTIQMKPTSYPSNEDHDSTSPSSSPIDDSENISQLWQLVGDCPENTIPIKRITKEDILRVDNITDFGIKTGGLNISQPDQFYHHANSFGDNGNEYAISFVKNGPFRGAKAKINIWKPRIQEIREQSLSQIWVVGGKFDSSLNSVESGIHVSPSVYGDANPRFFIYWTSDGYQKTGCYNHLCSGFIQVSKSISLGALIKPISVYNGPQYTLTFLIWKDPNTKNWWLQVNDKYMIGYWPYNLLPNLAHGANVIEWGGEVAKAKWQRQHTTTEMGSGHWPSGGYKKASYFNTVKIVDMLNVNKDPDELQTFASRPNCYNIKTDYSKTWGVFFFFGGPGRNANCR